MSRFAEWHEKQHESFATVAAKWLEGHDKGWAYAEERAAFHREAAAAIREAERAIIESVAVVSALAQSDHRASRASACAWETCRAALANLRGEK